MSFKTEREITATTQLPAERCFGDTFSGARPFPPITPEVLEDQEQVAQLSEVELKALKLGLHVYVTEADDFMFVIPDGVNPENPEVKSFVDEHSYTEIG